MHENQLTKAESMIQQLSLDELYRLNEMVVERIKFMKSAMAMSTMQQFNLGDMVRFSTDHGPEQGRIIRFNRKTVSLVTDAGIRWNVAPGLLSRVNGN